MKQEPGNASSQESPGFSRGEEVNSLTTCKPVNVMDTRPWKAIRFPRGGPSQHDFAKWFEAALPSVKFKLYDGAVEHVIEPYGDGSTWQWAWAIIGTWDLSDGVKAFHLRAGDWLIYRDKDLRAVSNSRYEANYQEAPR